jgi:Ca2+-dependent lipid-binding protein
MKRLHVKLSRGRNLDAKDLSGTSDPYIVITTKNEDGEFVKWKSEVVDKDLNPVWNKEFEIGYVTLLN